MTNPRILACIRAAKEARKTARTLRAMGATAHAETAMTLYRLNMAQARKLKDSQ